MVDRHPMWKDLGMDLETHDQLCAVLPTAFGDVYLSQENRPEGMAFWDMVVADVHGIRPAELIEEQKKGRKVFGTFCTYVPDEVVVACDGIVTGLCGGSQFWVPEGEKHLPADVCPLIKASLGARLGKTCPFFRIVDQIVGETTCDGKKKMYEIMAKDVPMHIMELPHMKRDVDVARFAQEIALFAKNVEEVTGNELTAEKLAEAIDIINNRRKALARVYETRKDPDTIPISGTDALLMMQIAFFDDPVRCAEMANKLADELEQRLVDKVSVFPAGTKRILLTGTPLAIPNWKLHHIIETSGAAIVCEENCTGTKFFTNLVDDSATTLEGQFQALAERYMKINCACFTPNEARIQEVIQLAKDYHVDGVINQNLKFCTTFKVEAPALEDALEEAGIPVLNIETDYTDNDAEQLRTRIGAFVEMLGE
ncbi:3-hydroxyacyl-ACP dehydratase [Denitrobacterium detoxificans]|uniref:Benzoyl-CoA reductase/2-hydroxyglutaryl-CoA dehydratase subunit, BcrC/BadD/HgdB n=2 Tax=Denitrobacterium detoxificans TaxID=79604 RepID=A0A172RX55_9ACTN|nr:double-cubane-cluster-containing anaerobic reductase [Denitrobacterium detoxificans]ANE22193.1 3-hydroxyacyl-ACP dehydratase [Denitrobacterium detoxificans]SEO65769.1 Benzoyl-CoA reductase/2-hydroxyglutaryl-CoA dehydratase subunit, BcrC/BadD/HgdB [Denitrobacterium detoxificans]